jgi:hypothetical protein
VGALRENVIGSPAGKLLDDVAIRLAGSEDEVIITTTAVHQIGTEPPRLPSSTKVEQIGQRRVLPHPNQWVVEESVAIERSVTVLRPA